MSPAGSSRRARFVAGWSGCILAVGLACAPTPAAAEVSPVRGMPYIRSYSLGDIGAVPRGSRLGFDRFGRLAVIHDAVYSVLNDTAWLNIAEQGGKDQVAMVNVVSAPDGRSYYGARGSWGYVESGKDGRLHPVSLTPATPPAWVATATFDHLLVTKRGIFFASWNGIAYWDFAGKRSFLLEVPRLSRLFRVGDQAYISAYDEPLRYVDVDAGAMRLAAGTELDRTVVELSTPLDETRSLVALVGGGLMVFDGKTVSPWPKLEPDVIRGPVSILQQLVDGRIAIGVTGQGVLLFSKEGEVLMALTTSQYHNIAALANREPGVLWVETEDSIEKILYGSPLSAFGQRLGLPVVWPIVAVWNDRIMVVSNGRLFSAVPGSRGAPTSFEVWPAQPPGGAWALAAWGSRMLVGNGDELFAVEPDGVLRPVRSVRNLAHLVMTDENHCYVIGPSEIALLEWRDGEWTEVVPRIPGAPNPRIVHRVGDSVWMEMGGGGVARLWHHDGRLQLEVIPNESWTKGSWVNIGSVDDIVMLSALEEEPHRFYDQKTGTWCDAPELQQLLDRSPYWITRLQRDENGVIWASHNEGLVRFAPGEHGYEMDATSFDLVNDRYPVVRILPGNEVWVLAERSLYHIERSWSAPSPRSRRPTLVSIVDLQRNEELLASDAAATPRRLEFAQNSLSFRFYSGTDAWRRSPEYEYRLGEHEPWAPLDSSLLSFRRLREGAYRLQVRTLAAQGDSSEPSTFEFEILPPWHRTWPAYLLMGGAGLLVLAGVTRWSSYLERRRNRDLEVWDMESPLLEGTELGDALRNLTTFINDEEVTIDVDVEGEPVALGRTANHNLLRIAQEATTNALRHAQAHRISIRLGYAGAAVTLTIADDGVGFLPNEVLRERTGHLGLRGIRTRVKRLKGTLAIDSVPGQGTTIRIEVPLREAAPEPLSADE